MRIWTPSAPKKPQQQQVAPTKSEKFVVVTPNTKNSNSNSNTNKKKKNPTQQPPSQSDDSTAGSSTCSTESETNNNNSSPPKRALGGRIRSNPYLQQSTVTTRRSFTPPSNTRRSSPQEERQQVLKTCKKLLQTRGFSIRSQLMALLQEESARLLQAQVRGYLIKRQYEEQVAAAKIIQLYYRQAMAQRIKTEEWRALLLEEYQDYYWCTRVGASIMLQSLVRGGLVRLALQKQHCAAYTIQSNYRKVKGLPALPVQKNKASQWQQVKRGIIACQAAHRGRAIRLSLWKQTNTATRQVGLPPRPPATTTTSRRDSLELVSPPPSAVDCDTPVHSNKYMNPPLRVVSSSEEDDDEGEEVHEIDSDSDSEDDDSDDDDNDTYGDDDGTYGDTYEGEDEEEEVPVEIIERLEQEATKHHGGWFNELVMDMVSDFEDTWKEMTVAEESKALEA